MQQAHKGARIRRTFPKEKFFSCVLCLVFLYFTFSGCDQIYGLLDKKGAEEKKLVGETIPYEENPTVKEIQTLLKIYGYNPGTPDGVLGFRTRDAIERFQKDNALETTRKVDGETWKQLKYFRDSGWIINGELNVKTAQAALQTAGFFSGKIDGDFGRRTKSAVMMFQEKNGLKSDGKVGYWTMKALEKYQK